MLKAMNKRLVIGLYRAVSSIILKTLWSEMCFSAPISSESLYGSSFHLSVPVGPQSHRIYYVYHIRYKVIKYCRSVILLLIVRSIISLYICYTIMLAIN